MAGPGKTKNGYNHNQWLVPLTWYPSRKLELYQIRKDPIEKENIVDQNPEITEKFTRQLNRWWQPE